MNQLPSSIAAASEAIRARELSSEELTRACLEATWRENPVLNAYLEVFEDALDQARASDKAIASGAPTSALAGIPLAVKDNILIRGRFSTAGSKILDGYVAAYDATAVAKLKAAGAVFLGRANLDEFAMGSSTEHSAFGPTRNPHDGERVPGGSSGGPAAAVAAGLALGALGSDTGGSIRQPAAFCGVVGLKPTYGSVSRFGLIAMASSLDQIGPIARTVSDARALYQAIRGQDPLDATSFEPMRQAPETKRQTVIGVPREYFGSGLDPDVGRLVRSAIERAQELGAEIREISLPHADYSLAAYYIVMSAEVSANLARFDGVRYGPASQGTDLLERYERTRAEGFGEEVKRRIMLGTYALSAGYYDAYYAKAQKVRRLIREDFEKALAEVDFILGPTAPTPPFRLGEKAGDPVAMWLADVYTVSANLAGVPAISIPAGWVKRDGTRLPVGLQIIGTWFAEDDLLDFAERLEEALGFFPS